MQTQREELNFKGENIYVGIDVHLKSWSVTILTEHTHHKTFNQPPEPEKLSAYLRSHFPQAFYYSAYEAGFSGLWTHYELESMGKKTLLSILPMFPQRVKKRCIKQILLIHGK